MQMKGIGLSATLVVFATIGVWNGSPKEQHFHGSVADGKTARPLPGATVQVADNGGTTNERGEFWVKATLYATDSAFFSVHATGYRGVRAVIPTGAPDVALARIDLTPLQPAVRSLPLRECELVPTPSANGMWELACPNPRQHEPSAEP